MKEVVAWSEYCKTLSPILIEASVRAPVSAGPGVLAKELARTAPDWHFRHAFCRGGWYRLGGVVDEAGNRISPNLEAWAEAALEERNGDLRFLFDDFADRKLYATRMVGRTHYLVAPAGDGAADFLQLEIEDLQEVRGHRLFSGDTPPASLEELVDPRGQNGQAQPLGLPYYAFRRLTHVGSFLQRMLAQRPEPAPVHRMLEDWQKSSAGQTSAYCNHWVIALREHLDRYQQPIFRAQPIAAREYAAAFSADSGTRGLKLHAALQAFDREAGYPFAWYFHMLTTKAVPHWVAQTVVEDALADFAYLPRRDVEVVRSWLHRPYSV
jgi:hypothetical protein